MKRSGVVLVLSLMLVLGSLCNVESLKSNYYAKSCPGAEDAIKKTVTAAINKDKHVAAGLLRLFFHDCFVEGCDASVLIDSPQQDAEKDAIPNQTLHSLDVIDNAKAAVEAICSKTVSCADIVAFSAATSVKQLGGPTIDIKGGRLDGFVSKKSEANSQIPSPFDNLSKLKSTFASKGLSTTDLVLLSGAHTLGNAHCGAFANRIRNFNSSLNVDPSLDATLATTLQNQCPVNPSPNIIRSMDPTSTVFDNKYYQDVRTKRGLFTSDAQLYISPKTKGLVDGFATNSGDFMKQFATALIKMGKTGVKSVNNGNIRTSCRSTK